MTEDNGARADMPERGQNAGGGMSAPPGQRGLTARRKQEAGAPILHDRGLEAETAMPSGVDGNHPIPSGGPQPDSFPLG